MPACPNAQSRPAVSNNRLAEQDVYAVTARKITLRIDRHNSLPAYIRNDSHAAFCRQLKCYLCTVLD